MDDNTFWLGILTVIIITLAFNDDSSNTKTLHNHSDGIEYVICDNKVFELMPDSRMQMSNEKFKSCIITIDNPSK